ncbi:MAG: hypothetical protein RL033_2264, partial [Pseudomonadota bacterium]
ERVFEMFAKIDRSVENANGGLGIGLALSRRIATLHDGALVGHSAGEGHGSTFTLSLPLTQGTEQTVAVAPVQELGGKVTDPGLNILVIEDNEDAAELLGLWLEQLGHRVRIGRSGPEGLALLREEVPELVFCDLGLPGMGGVEVCQQVRALALPAQPVMVALTGWGMKEDRERTRAAGFDHHLVKPVASDALLRILRGAGALFPHQALQ